MTDKYTVVYRQTGVEIEGRSGGTVGTAEEVMPANLLFKASKKRNQTAPNERMLCAIHHQVFTAAVRIFLSHCSKVSAKGYAPP